MKSLNSEAKSILSKSWIVQKTNHRLSTIPLDHAHEHDNAKVKGKYHIICQAEDPHALKKWIISAPEKATRVLTEFENVFKHDTGLELDYRHHDESISMSDYQKEISSLTEKIREYENPFFEISGELIVLDSRSFVVESCVKMMRDIETIGKRQYANFKKNIFENNKDIQSPTKGNKIPIFQFHTTKDKSTTPKKLERLKNDVSLLSRLKVANQLQEGDTAIFFSLDN